MAHLNEIAPDTYRISIYVPEFDLQFNHFLIVDHEPMLFHTGYRSMFSEIRDTVAKVLDPSKIRRFGFSHFESDECGSLNEWLKLAPKAKPFCTLVGALVSVNDYSDRPAETPSPDEALSTGKHQLRLLSTPHLPHGWDAGLLFDETTKTLFCSDLFHHNGDVEPLTGLDVVDRSRQAMVAMQAGPFAHYLPYTPQTGLQLHSLASLRPTTLAIMHGSSYQGDGESALRNLAQMLADTLRA